jgi:hypothetical protein
VDRPEAAKAEALARSIRRPDAPQNFARRESSVIMPAF